MAGSDIIVINPLETFLTLKTFSFSMTQVFPSRSRFIPAVLFKMLRSIGFQAVDMHFHSAYSMDAASSIPSVLKKCKSRGYGVAITDHNEIKGAVRAWRSKHS